MTQRRNTFYLKLRAHHIPRKWAYKLTIMFVN